MTSPTQNRPGFRWQLNIGILVFFLVFMPITLGLGFWQLERAAEKQELLAEHSARQGSEPVALDQVVANRDHQYRRVLVEGQFANHRTLLLENRIRHGRPGFEVVTLFERGSDQLPLWVNRGWIAGFGDRTQLPVVPPVAGVVTIQGHLYQALEAPFTLGEESWRQQWPQVLQNFELDVLTARLGREFFPYQLRLDQGAPGALDTGWEIVNVLPAKHIGYAVQWFALALALAVLVLFANSNLGTLIGFRKQPSPGETRK